MREGEEMREDSKRHCGGTACKVFIAVMLGG